MLLGPIGASAAGPRPRANSRAYCSLARVYVHHSVGSLSLNEELRRFWEVEELPRSTPLVPHDEACKAHFKGHYYSQDSDGRDVVRLPFKKGPPIDIGQSRSRAEIMLASLTQRFRVSPEQAEYREFMRDYEGAGYISRVSTPAFVNAYSRFCARRSVPQCIYSNNGTTFVGADRELAHLYRAALHDPNFLNSTASYNVEWRFIPPSAPHFKGLWEAGIRSVNHHLRRVLENYTFTFEELSTLLYRIEACVNSKLITPFHDSLEDCEPLTPGYFLIGQALTVNLELSVLTLNENRLSRWQLVCHVTGRFWKLWQSDYVNTLQQRTKWQKVQPQIRIGQLFLFHNFMMPPCKWKLGRVTRCHPGLDGLVRVITVSTATIQT